MLRRPLVLSFIASSTLAFLGTIGGCSAVNSRADESLGKAEERQQVEELLSARFCQTSAPKLAKCTLPVISADSTTFETAVPLRTVVEVVGDRSACSPTQRLELRLDAENAESTLFPFIATTSVTLRRRDAGVITHIGLTDSAPARTFQASMGPNCALSLRFRWNEPDVNNTAEAQAIIDRLQADANDKRQAYEALADVAAYGSLFAAYDGVLQSFYIQLSSGSLHDLRAMADSLIDTAATIDATCGDGISDQDRANLMSLVFAIGTLQGGTDFSLPDGGTKSLADVLAERAPTVRATLERLKARAQANAGDAGPSQADVLKRAADAAVAASTKVQRARAQLAAFLPAVP